MSVTVLSPEHSAEEALHPEEPEQPAKSDAVVNLSAASGDDLLSTVPQQSGTQDGFAIPSTSAPSSDSSRASSTRRHLPSQPHPPHPPHRHSNHRRANSESCISPTTFTPSSSSTPSSYNLRRGRKRPYRFQFVHPHYNNNGNGNGSGQSHGGGKHKRARKKHDGGSMAASSHHHLNGGVRSRKFVAQSSDGRGGGGSSSGARRRHVKKPKAPNNTSSFLIDDQQKREAADNSSDGTSTTAATRHRPRSYSSLAMVSPLEVDDDLDGSLEAQEDSEFAAEFDCASLERIEGLTRDQVNQEMLNVERMNRRLYDCVDNLKTENSKLKHLLEEKGISPPARDNNSTATNKMHAEELLDHLTKSRSSSTEGSGGAVTIAMTEEKSEEIKQSNV